MAANDVTNTQMAPAEQRLPAGSREGRGAKDSAGGKAGEATKRMDEPEPTPSRGTHFRPRWDSQTIGIRKRTDR